MQYLNLGEIRSYTGYKVENNHNNKFKLNLQGHLIVMRFIPTSPWDGNPFCICYFVFNASWLRVCFDSSIYVKFVSVEGGWYDFYTYRFDRACGKEIICRLEKTNKIRKYKNAQKMLPYKSGKVTSSKKIDRAHFHYIELLIHVD